MPSQTSQNLSRIVPGLYPPPRFEPRALYGRRQVWNPVITGAICAPSTTRHTGQGLNKAQLLALGEAHFEKQQPAFPSAFHTACTDARRHRPISSDGQRAPVHSNKGTSGDLLHCCPALVPFVHVLLVSAQVGRAIVEPVIKLQFDVLRLDI